MTEDEERIYFDYHQPSLAHNDPPWLTWLLNSAVMNMEMPTRAALIERLLLWKRYFEIGTTLTTPLKGLLLLFGVTSRNVGLTFELAALYGVLTFLAGWLWHRHGLMRTEFVIMNRFNDLADDVREMKAK